MKTLTNEITVERSVEGIDWANNIEELTYITDNLLSGNYGEHYYLYCQDFLRGETFDNNEEAVKFFYDCIINILSLNNNNYLIDFAIQNRSFLNDIILIQLLRLKEEFQEEN